MSSRYFTEADVQQRLDIRIAIEAVREAFLQLAQGQAMNVPRKRAIAPGAVLHSMSATAHYLGRMGWKQYSTTSRGARFLVGLYEMATGELLALIEADRLGQLRTGAVTGVAVECLAKPLPTELGLFGCGWQARSQLAAVATVCPLRRAYVYCRNEERRKQFAREMQDELQIEVVPVSAPQEAVQDRPLVITATTSKDPVFDGKLLREGALVCAVGSNWLHKAEIDVETVRRARLIVCDSVECCREEAGDFSAALRQGLFHWEQALSLGQVLAQPPDLPSRGIVLFKSVGMAIEDVALATRLLEIADA